MAFVFSIQSSQDCPNGVSFTAEATRACAACHPKKLDRCSYAFLKWKQGGEEKSRQNSATTKQCSIQFWLHGSAFGSVLLLPAKNTRGGPVPNKTKFQIQQSHQEPSAALRLSVFLIARKFDEWSVFFLQHRGRFISLSEKLIKASLSDVVQKERGTMHCNGCMFNSRFGQRTHLNAPSLLLLLLDWLLDHGSSSISTVLRIYASCSGTTSFSSLIRFQKLAFGI